VQRSVVNPDRTSPDIFEKNGKVNRASISLMSGLRERERGVKRCTTDFVDFETDKLFRPEEALTCCKVNAHARNRGIHRVECLGTSDT